MILLAVSRMCKERKVDFSTVSLKVSPISQRWVIESAQEVRISVGVGFSVRAMVRLGFK